MNSLTQHQYNVLVQGIFDSIMSNPDFGFGEMGESRDEAERIVKDWAEECSITLPE